MTFKFYAFTTVKTVTEASCFQAVYACTIIC